MNNGTAKLTSEIVGDNDDATTTINLGEGLPPRQFVGLSKEDLKRYENDPFWKRIRLGLFIGFWVVWCILLVAAILILVYTPPCPKTINVFWAQKGAAYSVHVAKFVQPLRGDRALLEQDLSDNLAVLSLLLDYPSSWGFNYLILSDSPVDAYEKDHAALDSLRQAARERDLKLVLKVKCTEEDSSACLEKKNVQTLVDRVIEQLKFDGLHVTVGKNQGDFNESVLEHMNSQVHSIGKRTMTQRALLVEQSSDQAIETIAADVRVCRALQQWTKNSNASDLVKLIAQSKNANGWLLDDITSNRIADRGLNTLNALHVVYLLPGTPIINYGTEAFLSDRACKDLQMPWNRSSCDFGGDNYQNVENLSGLGRRDISPYGLIADLSRVRADHPLFTFGELYKVEAIQDNVLYWEIRHKLHNIYTVAINIGPKPATIPLFHSEIPSDSENCSFTVIHTYNTKFLKDQVIKCEGYDYRIPINNLNMPANSSLVLKSSFVHKKDREETA